MKDVYVRYENEKTWSGYDWKFFGAGNGHTLEEVVRDILANSGYSESQFNPVDMTYNGWKLSFGVLD